MQEFDYSNETSNDLYDAVDGCLMRKRICQGSILKK